MTGREIHVHVADFKVGGAGDTLLTIGLGSCVAIMLHDREATVGGLAHVLLPSPSLSRREQNPGKFPQSAIPLLVSEMTAAGANPKRITARIAGGASMFQSLQPSGTIQMGERNAVAVRNVLGELNIPLIGSAIGGDYGRTVRFFISDGRIEVTAVRREIEHL
ncbi:MAG TPA: chemotaxis protein CheD [Gemmatimonadales bacterium]|nr:chemotaxis protein CheD [Gemmatimonadales bacterium]